MCRIVFLFLVAILSHSAWSQTYDQLLEKGVALYKKGELEESIVVYTKAIDLDSTIDNGYLCRGASYRALHKYKEALRDYGKAQRYNVENNPDVYYNRSNLFYEIKDYNNALAEINKAIKIAPYNSYFQMNKGLIFFELNKSEDATRMFLYAIQLDSSNTKAYANLCNCLVRDAHYDEAILACEEAKKHGKENDYSSLMNLALIYQHKQTYQKALDILLDLEKRYPEKKSIIFNQLGYSYMKDKQFGKAIPYFKYLVKEKKYIFESNYNLAFCNLKLEKYEDALAGFDEVIKMNPEYAYSYNNRAFCYYQLNKFDKATEDCNKAIEIEPTSSYSYFLLGKINHLFNQDKDACEAFNKAKSLGSKEEELPRLMAESCR